MVFARQGIIARSLCTVAFIELTEFSKPPYDVVGPDVVKWFVQGHTAWKRQSRHGTEAGCL